MRAFFLMCTGGEVPHQNAGTLSQGTKGLGTCFPNHSLRHLLPVTSAPPAAAETSSAVAWQHTVNQCRGAVIQGAQAVQLHAWV